MLTADLAEWVTRWHPGPDEHHARTFPGKQAHSGGRPYRGCVCGVAAVEAGGAVPLGGQSRVFT